MKNKVLRIIPFIILFLIGIILGVLSVIMLGKYLKDETSNLFILFFLFSIYAAFFLQIIIHEAGHLVFGLITGYKFGSFRILNFMIVNEDGKLKTKNFSLAGTGGQCIMTPPELVDGKIPVILYNLGGSIMNVISGILAISALLIVNSNLLSAFLIEFAFIGFLSAAVNGIPLECGPICNDGYNALSLYKNDTENRSFWLQLKVVEEQSKGIRLREMNDEWFTTPSDEEMKNPLTAAVGVFCCNRLMDLHRFEEADSLMKHYLSIENGIVGIHKGLLICDRIYIEMIGENRKDIIASYLSKEQLKFMKSMAGYISVLRTEYIYALLVENDPKKAEKLKNKFDKCIKSYPYKSDVQSELELIEIALENGKK